MKHLYDSLRACAKEDEVKAEFCKSFKMKIFALRGIDHYTEFCIVAAAITIATFVALAAPLPQPEPTLDEIIDALPDEWGERRSLGIASNNYVVLNRITAMTNVKERIRLTWKLYDHFRHSPEWYVEHREGGLESPNRNRHDFFGCCAWKLIAETNVTPETIVSGWKMEAETIRDLAEVIRLTGPEWQEQMQKRHEAKLEKEFLERRKKHRGTVSFLSQRTAPEIEYVRAVEARMYNFFRLFAGHESFQRLPDEMKPAFVEQMKRDFFIYNYMTNVYFLKQFPPELKKAYKEVRSQMEGR